METFVVILIVAVAGTWGAWRVRKKLRAPSRSGTCTSGCGGCGGRADAARKCVGLVVAGLLLSSQARALDTTEPFAKGASDVELYCGGDGLSRTAAERNAWTAFQLGYGLTERLSFYLNGSATSDRFFRRVDRSLGFGLYGTVIDTQHLHLDLFFDLSLSSGTLSAAAVAPGLELNLDPGPFGLFATVFEVMSGRERTPAGGGESDAARVFDTELGVGARWIVADGHELLVAYEFYLHHVPESGQGTVEIGGVGAGYNVMVNDSVELDQRDRLRSSTRRREGGVRDLNRHPRNASVSSPVVSTGVELKGPGA